MPISKRKKRNKRAADNPFTAFTGIKPVKLTGKSDCWIVGQKHHALIPVRKVSYATHHADFPTWKITPQSSRMKNLRVKQTCGVDQCVNPDHLVGNESSL